MKPHFGRMSGIAVVMGLMLTGGAAIASDNHIVVAPGGPHPYFAVWEQAAADAQKDFGIASVKYRVPSDWKLELQTELMEKLGLTGRQWPGHLSRRPGRRELDDRRVEN